MHAAGEMSAYKTMIIYTHIIRCIAYLRLCLGFGLGLRLGLLRFGLALGLKVYSGIITFRCNALNSSSLASADPVQRRSNRIKSVVNEVAVLIFVGVPWNQR